MKMKIQTLLVYALVFQCCLVTSVSAQIVPVGSGSYTTKYPGADVAGRNGFPPGSPQVSGDALGKPVPTNDWWSAVVRNDHAGNLFNYPLSMKTVSSGLVMSYIPSGVFDDQEPVIIGTSGLNASKATVSDYSDWTVQFDWQSKFKATSGIGMPFVYFTKGATETAQVRANLGTVTIQNERLIIADARNGADFVVYAPVGSTWSKNGNLYTSTLNGKNYWSAVMLPQSTANPVSEAAAYQKYAYVFPENTLVEWTYDEQTATSRSVYSIQSTIQEGTADQLLIGLLPHQWAHLAADSPTPTKTSYTSIRGELKMLEGTTFTVEHNFHGILPTLPYLSNYSDKFDLTELDRMVQGIENDGLATWTDSYNEGQVMNRLIQTARIADKMGNLEARDKMIATVKERLEDWLTAESSEVAFLFYYNQDWSAMLGYPAGHGQDNNINDHHFHWGYFIHAASFMEQYEPGWAEQWGGMIDLLVRDAATADRSDDLFPFLRNFSPYAGHSWANGFASFPQGNDQESTSESMQFNSALIHWGSITGNDSIRDLGIYLYTTEKAAIDEYWFDTKDRVFAENHPFSLVSRVWGNSYDNGTFWTADIEASYGIELYPIHGGSLYLGHDTLYAARLWAEIEQNTGILSKDDNVNLWHDTMWKFLSMTDADKAIELYERYPERNLKFGISSAQTYYWIHAMQPLGKVETAVTADHELAVTFIKNGEKTYVAHNYSDQELTVNFSDGYQLLVPAASMATSKDVAIDASVSTSFATAYPGGSVEVQTVLAEGTADSVQFLQNGQLLSTDFEAPFEVTAGELPAGIYGYYARVYQGADFDVTNISRVTVGSQEAYQGNLHAIPGTIEAGQYDQFPGGSANGIGYLDTSPGNNGDFRVSEDVDAVLVDGEGATVGWIGAGEWMEYSIKVEKSGLYNMDFRYACGNQTGGGPFNLTVGDRSLASGVTVGYTSGWDKWQTKSVTALELTEGEHILRVSFENGEVNLGKMTFSFQSDLTYTPPIAKAGNNISIKWPENTTTLDGSSSTAASPDDLVYSWSQLNGPSVLAFSDKAIAKPEVSNLIEGIYTVVLTVTDGTYTSEDELLIVVSETGNSKPSVSLVSPEKTAEYEKGQTVMIRANASDIEGEVKEVHFYSGEHRIGTATTKPFELSYKYPPQGTHVIRALAIDADGAQAWSEAHTISIVVPQSCTKTLTSAQQGSFSKGYEVKYKTIGGSVEVTFKLLDTDKSGVIAYLWQKDPFNEVQMKSSGHQTFTSTIGGALSAGDVISYGCKFAFAGGLAATTYIDYTVGSSCDAGDSNQPDTNGPANFTVVVDSVGQTNFNLSLHATDNTDSIQYTVQLGDLQLVRNGASGQSIQLQIDSLAADSLYSVEVKAEDFSGNFAEIGSVMLSIRTDTLPNTDTVVITPPIEEPPVAITDPGYLEQITAYPNPTSGLLTVQIPQELVTVKLALLNLNGQAVQLRFTQKGNVLTADLSALAAGIYLLKVQGESSEEYFIRVVRN